MIIFVDNNGTERAPMAAEIFKSYKVYDEKEILARGMVVAFSEPINPKVAAVLASDGIDISGFSSVRLSNEEITEDTIILAIGHGIKDGIISSFKNATEDNTFDICDYAGEELYIIDPYGGPLTTYGICYESMKSIVKKVIKKMEDGNE